MIELDRCNLNIENTKKSFIATKWSELFETFDISKLYKVENRWGTLEVLPFCQILFILQNSIKYMQIIGLSFGIKMKENRRWNWKTFQRQKNDFIARILQILWKVCRRLWNVICILFICIYFNIPLYFKFNIHNYFDVLLLYILF